MEKSSKLTRFLERLFLLFLFINPLLDTAVERFGTKDAIYAKVDDRHFSVTAQVEISDLFYGWLLGFGKRIKLTYPDDAVEGFKAYLDKVRAIYE